MTKKEAREKAIREIFSGTSLESRGYRCTKKSIYLEKNGYKQIIVFGSAISANRIDEVNIFEISAYILHDGFRRYRKEKYDLDNGYIGGAGIENLFTFAPPYIHYDLGTDEQQYYRCLERAKKIIESNVFRLFEEFTNPEKLITNFKQPCFLIDSTIEFLSYIDKKQLAEKLVEMLIENSVPLFETYLMDYNNRLKNGESRMEVERETYGDAVKRTAFITAEGLFHSDVYFLDT